MKTKLLLLFCSIVTFSVSAQTNYETSWRFYRPGNTGIQGDMATALWLDSDGNPYIAANTGNWGEGGFAKFNQVQNKWHNFSNVDLPVLGSFDNGDIQITDFVKDQNDNVWMSKFTGAIKFNPSEGASSIESYDITNSPFTGITYDVDLAPDGSVWFANEQTVKYNPTDNRWTSFDGSNQLLSVQPKADGSYIVWIAGYYLGNVMQYDSATGLTINSTPINLGDIAGLPGKDCTDDNGNFWALRMAENGDYNTLEYQKQDGTWVNPAHPYSNFTFYIDAFKAVGNEEAVMVIAGGEVWRFDGTTWLNYGVWRQGDNNTSVDMDANGNVWVCGLGGAAKRDVTTGLWQRYRLTNTSQIDYFVEDITIDNDGSVWMTGNAGTGVGGIQKYDGSSWTGFNPYTYELGNDFPFDADNATAITCRQSTNNITFSPTFHGVHTWNGANFTSQESELVTSKGLVEDSQGRLWSLGEYYNYKLFDDTTNQWANIPIIGWGQKIIKDPTVSGTVWVTTDSQIVRTNGTDVLTLNSDDYYEPSAFQFLFTGIAVEPTGILWTATYSQGQTFGSKLIKYDTATGQSVIWSHDEGWPFPGEHVMPLTTSPDGRIWMAYNSEYPSTEAGILAFDGTNVELFPAADGGFPDWNILPNGNIKDIEVKTIENGYELWMSCLGRGIAVLKVTDSNLAVNPVNEVITSLAKVYPNPATEQVMITFDNTNNEPTEIAVYDLTGRQITTLLNKTTAGTNTLNWDLTANNGNKVASGLYLIKLKTPTKTTSTKLIVK